MSAGAAISAPGRILCAVLLGTGLATASEATPSLAAAALVTTTCMVTSGDLRRALRVVLPVSTLATVALLPLAVTGGAVQALRIALRAVLSCVAMASVLAALDLREVEGALLSLGAPRALAATVAGTLRQWARLTEEGKRLLLARSLRGPLRVRDSAALLGGFFVRAAERAERLEIAMALRGYLPERAGRRLRFGPWDAPFVVASVLAGALVHAAPRVFR